MSKCHCGNGTNAQHVWMGKEECARLNITSILITGNSGHHRKQPFQIKTIELIKPF